MHGDPTTPKYDGGVFSEADTPTDAAALRARRCREEVERERERAERVLARQASAGVTWQ